MNHLILLMKANPVRSTVGFIKRQRLCFVNGELAKMLATTFQFVRYAGEDVSERLKMAAINRSKNH